MPNTILDKNRLAITAGSLVRVKFCDSPYGQTQTIEGTVQQIDQYNGATLVLAKPAIWRCKDRLEHRKVGDLFYVPLPVAWNGSAYVCDKEHLDFDHGHHAWAEVLDSESIEGSGMAQITFTTKSGQSYTMTPVPMVRMPSGLPQDWLKFQGKHVGGTEMSETAMSKLQSFMLKHRTEALTDGKRNYTLAGGMLAECDPGQIV